ncbi:CCL14 protein, partial [Bucorvus abyssinicus]|nr:CCL14 protein [Bucorvus abyssinicus]
PAPYRPSECCFSFAKGPLRLAKLRSFHRTPKDCYNPAVVFETKNGTKVCANPEETWVEKRVESLQKRNGLDA